MTISHITEIQSPDDIITAMVEFTLKNGSRRYIDSTLREITKCGQSDQKMDTTIEFTLKNWSRTYIICPRLNKRKHISQLGHRLHNQHKLGKCNRPQQHSGKVCLLEGGYWFRELGSIPSLCNFCVDTQNHKESVQSARSPYGVRVSPRSPRGLRQDPWGSVKYCQAVAYERFIHFLKFTDALHCLRPVQMAMDRMFGFLTTHLLKKKTLPQISQTISLKTE